MHRSFRRAFQDEPSEVMALGSSVSFVFIGAALAVALVAGRLVGGFFAWPLGAFPATVTYLMLFALEIGLADLAKRRI